MEGKPLHPWKPLCPAQDVGLCWQESAFGCRQGCAGSTGCSPPLGARKAGGHLRSAETPPGKGSRGRGVGCSTCRAASQATEGRAGRERDPCSQAHGVPGAVHCSGEVLSLLFPPSLPALVPGLQMTWARPPKITLVQETRRLLAAFPARPCEQFH